MSEIIGMARRVKFHDARRAFENGGTILVSEYGNEEWIPVTRTSTTHVRGATDWGDLIAEVRMWRGRYPNQRFYIVESLPLASNE